MLKLSKKSWLILSAGAFIIIIASLGFTHSQQLQAQSQLSEELSIAEVRLSKLQIEELRQQQADLQKQVDESTIQLAAAKDQLRQTVESISVTDKFFEIAESLSVEVTSISSSDIKSDKLGDIACSTTSLNAVVEGMPYNLISFVMRLNSDFTTGVVKSAQVSIPATANDSASVNIMMVVYTYEGD